MTFEKFSPGTCFQRVEMIQLTCAQLPVKNILFLVVSLVPLPDCKTFYCDGQQPENLDFFALKDKYKSIKPILNVIQL